MVPCAAQAAWLRAAQAAWLCAAQAAATPTLPARRKGGQGQSPLAPLAAASRLRRSRAGAWAA